MVNKPSTHLETLLWEALGGRGKRKTGEPSYVVEVALVQRGARPIGTESVDTETAGRFFSEWIGSETSECLAVLVCDSRRQAIACELISRGGVGEVQVHPSPILRTAVRESGAAIYFSHNHPSGDPSPSDADILATGIVHQACGILKIELLDHIVVAAGGRWASIREIMEDEHLAQAKRAADGR